jgi:diaminohydroxyphosphoribosylaminopyrimidine deaminase/5-amino-6-(5-phosphoribosylamino)uracil reductase
MTIGTDTDRLHLARAIELAGQGVGAVKPNPVVGAVVARDGEVLGEGWHERFGGAHAEVNAIEGCGMADLTGATLYVSLEPCCHEGKTPPCTDAIVQSGIRRVVVGSDDPTEKAAGRGLGILRDEGIEVVIADGELATRARLLNQAFRKHARVGRPWVLFKSAMTLDGKVATRAGDSQWISGEASRELAHRWRASVDAVVVGIGTALADDPRLTARPDGTSSEPSGQPRRVVFDSLARLPADSRLLAATGMRAKDSRLQASAATGMRAEGESFPASPTAAEIPLTVVVSRAAARADTDALEAAGAQVLLATGENEPARVRSALDQLGQLGVASLLLEGGPHLAGAFLDAGEIDEIRLFLAPLLLGGRTARDPLEGEGVERISDALRALTFDCERIGDDLLVCARLREW